MADAKPRIRVKAGSRLLTFEDGVAAQAARAVLSVDTKAAPSDSIRAYEMARGNRALTADSFQNFSLNLGLGTNNALSDSTYGFLPVTRDRTLLEWIYRG